MLTDLPKILLGKLHSVPNLINSSSQHISVSKRNLGKTLGQVNDSAAYWSKSSVCTAQMIPAQADGTVQTHYCSEWYEGKIRKIMWCSTTITLCCGNRNKTMNPSSSIMLSFWRDAILGTEALEVSSCPRKTLSSHWARPQKEGPQHPYSKT